MEEEERSVNNLIDRKRLEEAENALQSFELYFRRGDYIGAFACCQSVLQQLLTDDIKPRAFDESDRRVLYAGVDKLNIHADVAQRFKLSVDLCFDILNKSLEEQRYDYVAQILELHRFVDNMYLCVMGKPNNLALDVLSDEKWAATAESYAKIREWESVPMGYIKAIVSVIKRATNTFYFPITARSFEAMLLEFESNVNIDQSLKSGIMKESVCWKSLLYTKDGMSNATKEYARSWYAVVKLAIQGHHLPIDLPDSLSGEMLSTLEDHTDVDSETEDEALKDYADNGIYQRSHAVQLKEERGVNNMWREYTGKTKHVKALRLTCDNVKDYEGKVEGALIPGNYIVDDGTKMYYESDGTFRHYYCPDDFSDEDKKLWSITPTIVKMRHDTAEDAVQYMKEHPIKM